ncbi:MAG: twin-arginine translocase subunit TatC [Zetaproteobacteria bacterium]|nr:MAG: twin-arginine translocase subunit TatC [Zetaproteobacteria bacterium]
MVWLGKKVFDMRQKLSVKRKLIPEDEEKPFLEHLEDLRKMFMRVLITLLVTMVASFMFNDQIFKLIEYPIHKAEIGVPEQEQSPLGLKDPHEWLEVASTAHALIGKSEAQRALILEHAFAGERAHLRPVLEAMLIHHAAVDLPEETREGYIKAAAMAAGNESLIGMVRDMEAKKVDVSFEKGPKQMRMWFSKPGEGFNLSMKLALYAGIVVGFPLLLYFLLEFIVPGLRPEERRILWPAMAVGFALFLGGVAFAYYVVTPNALRFLYQYDLSLGGVADYRMTDYVSFVVQFTLIFGLCFELPVIVYALNKLGVLSYELMKRTRSYAIIIIVVIAALLTPTTDLVNLALLAVPMVLLYELSIWIAFFHDKAVKKREAAEEEADRAARAARHERASMAGAYLDAPADAPGHHDSHHDSPPFHDHHDDHAHDHHAHGYDHHGHDHGAHGSGDQGRYDHATGEMVDASHDAEGRLTAPPSAESDSYHDRAEPWSGTPPAPGPETNPPDAVAPTTAGEAHGPAGAEAATGEPVTPAEPAATPASAPPTYPHTEGEPSEEARRHRD